MKNFLLSVLAGSLVGLFISILIQWVTGQSGIGITFAGGGIAGVVTVIFLAKLRAANKGVGPSH
ncbi:hypothetical protein AQ1_02446 [alpha proteobacterium Q-1]|nr:hypothetical protein AQ1_02446 [alpha proteobacterium Q-1]